MKLRTSTLLFVLTICMFNLSCKKELETQYEGTWAGSSSTGRWIALTIIENRVASFIVETCSISYNAGNDIIIKNGKFSIKGTGVDISGQFSSARDASGSVSISSANNCSLSINETWTARKN